VKFDKTLVFVFALGAALIIGWPHICRKMGWLPETTSSQHQTTHQESATAPSSSDSAVKHNDNTAEKLKVKTDQVLANSSELTAKTGNRQATALIEQIKKFPVQIISNEYLSLTISPAIGAVTSTKLKKFLKSDLKSNILIGGNMPHGALGTSMSPTGQLVEIVSSRLIAPNSYQLKRKIQIADKIVQLTQQWTLVEGYQIECQSSIKNLSSQPLSLEEIALSGYALQPLKQLSGDVALRETHGIDYLTTAHKFNSLDADDESILVKNENSILWFGAGDKYFAGILKAKKPFDELVVNRVKRTNDVDNKSYYTIMASGVYSQITIAPNMDKSLAFTAFCGPKEFNRLKEFVPAGENMLHLSWGPLDAIAGWLLRFLVWLHSKCGSYGLSIIILTMMVRMLFWPVTQKANKSMKKMQQLQPLVAELKEKYKDTPQVMNSKVMELYREKHVSPLGGCLPILLQIPVFSALYATLGGAVELRQVSFLWAADLSRPDTIATIFGIAINPLVIAMTITMAIQQKLTPMSGDPMQKKIMMFMPLIMLFFLYSLPSGLTLYWTVSQIFSILQLLITQKLDGKNNETAVVAAK
jgi:YidC/Oxa1 family membrane protein insertase